jgi:PAB-dependent poly(A)-specific ribonuclease subunit 2
MPYYREQLLSAWTGSDVYEVGRPPAKIDPDILSQLKTHEVGQWATNPRKVRRNQAEKTRVADSDAPAIAAPRFLSEKAREVDNDHPPEKKMSELQESMGISTLNEKEIPIMYRNVEIKYSRFGIEDFDFK